MSPESSLNNSKRNRDHPQSLKYFLFFALNFFTMFYFNIMPINSAYFNSSGADHFSCNWLKELTSILHLRFICFHMSIPNAYD